MYNDCMYITELTRVLWFSWHGRVSFIFFSFVCVWGGVGCVGVCVWGGGCVETVGPRTCLQSSTFQTHRWLMYTGWYHADLDKANLEEQTRQAYLCKLKCIHGHVSGFNSETFLFRRVIIPKSFISKSCYSEKFFLFQRVAFPNFRIMTLGN